MQIDSERGPRLGHLRKRLCERRGLERTVALRRKLLGANRRKFVLGRRKIREKAGLAWTRATVAAPMVRPSITSLSQCTLQDEAALAEGEAAREDRVALPWRSLGEDEGPGPAGRRMT